MRNGRLLLPPWSARFSCWRDGGRVRSRWRFGPNERFSRMNRSRRCWSITPSTLGAAIACRARFLRTGMSLGLLLSSRSVSVSTSDVTSGDTEQSGKDAKKLRMLPRCVSNQSDGCVPASFRSTMTAGPMTQEVEEARAGGFETRFEWVAAGMSPLRITARAELNDILLNAVPSKVWLERRVRLRNVTVRTPGRSPALGSG